MLISGCGGADSKTPPVNENRVEYVVRGRVITLPQPDRPASELVVHHEPLPSYMSGGEVIGMPAMHMPFPIQDGVSLESIKVGDPVTLTFEVEYDPQSKTPVDMYVTQIVALPDDTVLILDE